MIESNLVLILVLSVVFNLILVHKLGILKEKVKDYEERLLISSRPKIPTSGELMRMWGERQFHIHTFYAFFPVFLRLKKKIIDMSIKNAEEVVPERVKNFIERNLRTDP